MVNRIDHILTRLIYILHFVDKEFYIEKLFIFNQALTERQHPHSQIGF